ncbi:MAG: hypothetical protein CFE33_15145 [Pseudorhodobacter sp. PARRP1]|nr:MAG: hypothetical protein CFE33_15145 [Pseudorhodobacter sp. PARRP1]
MKALVLAVLICALALVGLTALAPALPAATVSCAPAADLLQQLKAKFAEVPLFSGDLAGKGRGGKLIITANPNGSTWTALFAVADGKACIAATGGPFRPGDPIPLGQEG